MFTYSTSTLHLTHRLIANNLCRIICWMAEVEILANKFYVSFSHWCLSFAAHYSQLLFVRVRFCVCFWFCFFIHFLVLFLFSMFFFRSVCLLPPITSGFCLLVLFFFLVNLLFNFLLRCFPNSFILHNIVQRDRRGNVRPSGQITSSR